MPVEPEHTGELLVRTRTCLRLPFGTFDEADELHLDLPGLRLVRQKPSAPAGAARSRAGLIAAAKMRALWVASPARGRGEPSRRTAGVDGSLRAAR